MDIYIIHELYIVKIIYLKNNVSHNGKELNGFAAVGHGLPPAGNGPQPFLLSLWDRVG
jgi:hypothetical protein